MRKKTISLICALTLCFTLSSPALAFNIEEKTPELTADSIRDAYSNSEQFQAHLRDDPAGAMQTLNHVIDRLLTPSASPMQTTPEDDYAWVDTVLVKQLNSISCGPACGYMAIYGAGEASSIPGSSTTAKLQNLASEMGTASGVGTYVYRVANTLNDYISTYQYDYFSGDVLSESNFRLYAYNSLAHDRAPILHARTEYLSYYNGHATGHYITVADFDYDTMTMELYDPNNNSRYYGIHTVDWQEAYDCFTIPSGRYVILYA